MSQSPAIEFAHVQYRTAGNRLLLSDLNLKVRQGEILMLLGPSGSGKTTTLKLINSMLTPSEGDVRVEGRSLRDWDVIKLRRRIGYAIQEGGLFPHYTVWKNVSLVPRLENWPEEKINKRVEEVLKMVGLPSAEFGQRYPDQISGGQRQRVGLARALAADPPILLMDEPFGALDPITRAEMQEMLRELMVRLKKTVLLVTHDLDEAIYLAGRLVLLGGGKLMASLAPEEFLRSCQPEVESYVRAFHRGE